MGKRLSTVHIGSLQRVVGIPVTDRAELRRAETQYRRRRTLDTFLQELDDALESIADDPVGWLEVGVTECKCKCAAGTEVIKLLKRVLKGARKRKLRGGRAPWRD